MNYIDKIVDLIIRPNRDHYHTKRLGDPEISIETQNGEVVKALREDRIILNKHNEHLHLSYFEIKSIAPINKQNTRKDDSHNTTYSFHPYDSPNNQSSHQQQSSSHPNQQPQFPKPIPIIRNNPKQKCVIYLHANNGSRIQGLPYLSPLLSAHCNVCLFDCSGSGVSDGEYITLGLKEARDLQCVISFLYKEKGMREVALWGRSMGASTAIVYAAKYGGNSQVKVRGMVLDSPFKDLEKLVKEVAADRTGLPKIMFQPVVGVVRGEILKKTGCNIGELKMKKYMQPPLSSTQSSIQPSPTNALSTIPALFILSKSDKLVKCHHGEKLFKRYPCENKELYYIGVEHHQTREEATVGKVVGFIVGGFSGGDRRGSWDGERKGEFVGNGRMMVEPLQFSKNALNRSRCTVDLNISKEQQKQSTSFSSYGYNCISPTTNPTFSTTPPPTIQSNINFNQFTTTSQHMNQTTRNSPISTKQQQQKQHNQSFYFPSSLGVIDNHADQKNAGGVVHSHDHADQGVQQDKRRYYYHQKPAYCSWVFQQQSRRLSLQPTPSSPTLQPPTNPPNHTLSHHSSHSSLTLRKNEPLHHPQFNTLQQQQTPAKYMSPSRLPSFINGWSQNGANEKGFGEVDGFKGMEGLFGGQQFVSKRYNAGEHKEKEKISLKSMLAYQRNLTQRGMGDQQMYTDSHSLRTRTQQNSQISYIPITPQQKPLHSSFYIPQYSPFPASQSLYIPNNTPSTSTPQAPSISTPNTYHPTHPKLMYSPQFNKFNWKAFSSSSSFQPQNQSFQKQQYQQNKLTQGALVPSTEKQKQSSVYLSLIDMRSNQNRSRNEVSYGNNCLSNRATITTNPHLQSTLTSIIFPSTYHPTNPPSHSLNTSSAPTKNPPSSPPNGSFTNHHKKKLVDLLNNSRRVYLKTEEGEEF